jgi:hypothetical protein
MKKYIIYPTLLVSLILIASSVCSRMSASPTDDPMHRGPGDLLAYVQPIAGTWVAEDQFAAAAASDHNLQALGRLSFFALHIDPTQIRGDEIRIAVTEYCQPELAQYIHFRLAGDRLEYTGASFDDWSFDMTRIDFMYLSYVAEGDELILSFEAMETEMQNYQLIRMVRLPETEPQAAYAYWQCGLQYFLISLLLDGDYDLYDETGNQVEKDRLIGDESSRETLRLLSANGTLQPAFEELCVRSAFDIVVLRSNAPETEEGIYALAWAGDNLLLYETILHDLARNDQPPLRRGRLLYTIVPHPKYPQESL